jgi:nicotinate-nucleotide adenylyltransferase
MQREQPDVQIFLIVGADTAQRLSTWHRPEVVRSLSTLVIVNRNGQPTPADMDSAIHVFMDPVDASSTDIRRRVLHGEPIDNLTTRGVVRIIETNGLYRSAP